VRLVWVGNPKQAKLLPFQYSHEHVKVEDSLDCSDREMVDFRILRGGSKATRGITALDVRRADGGLFIELAWRNSMGYHSEEKKGSGKLADFQGSPPLNSKMVYPRAQEIKSK